MKKAIFVIILAMLLTSCRVGPEEKPKEALTEPLETATEPITEMIVPETEPEPIITEPANVEPPVPAETEPEEPADIPEEDMEDEPDEIEIDEVDFDTLYATISLNVRSGPSTDYGAIGFLDPGEAADIIGCNYDSGWYAIAFNGGTGWVSGSYMTDVPPALPEEDEEEPIDIGPVEISEEHAKELIIAYAGTYGLGALNIRMDAYYGEFEQGEVAAFSTKGDEGGSEVINVSGYEIKLPKPGSHMVFMKGGADDISTAYSMGHISDDEMKMLKRMADEKAYAGPIVWEEAPQPEFPKPEPLSESLRKKIIEDYAAIDNTDPEKVAINSYYGSYAAGEAVVMVDDQPFTDDLKEFEVAGCPFVLGSSMFELTIHTPGGEFIPIEKAYSDRLISDIDVAMISFYNGTSY